MKRIVTVILSLSIAAVALLQFASCEKYVLPELVIDPDTLYFGAVADSQAIFIRSNVTWAFHSEDDEWVYTTTPWGDTDTEIYVGVNDNDSDCERTASVRIKSETIERILTVIQEGYLPLEPEESL